MPPLVDDGKISLVGRQVQGQVFGGGGASVNGHFKDPAPGRLVALGGSHPFGGDHIDDAVEAGMDGHIGDFCGKGMHLLEGKPAVGAAVQVVALGGIDDLGVSLGNLQVFNALPQSGRELLPLVSHEFIDGIVPGKDFALRTDGKGGDPVTQNGLAIRVARGGNIAHRLARIGRKGQGQPKLYKPVNQRVVIGVHGVVHPIPGVVVVPRASLPPDLPPVVLQAPRHDRGVGLRDGEAVKLADRQAGRAVLEGLPAVRSHVDASVGAGVQAVSKEFQGVDVGVGIGGVIAEPFVEFGEGIAPVQALPDIEAPHIHLIGIGG